MASSRVKTPADIWRERAEFLEKENTLLRIESTTRIHDLEEKILVLMTRIEKLESQLEDEIKKNSKNSNNSSKPPSSDQKENLPKKNQSLRQKSDRKSGGQPGHPGYARGQSENPDTIILCTPEVCISCGMDFKKYPWKDSSVLSRRQEIDIPPIIPIITEFRRMEVRCSCGAKTCGSFPPSVKGGVQFGNTLTALVSYLSGAHYLPYDRLSTLFSDILGISMSEGSIENLLERSYTKTKVFGDEILRIIKTQDWVGSDETGDRVNGENFWRWVWQNVSGSYFHFDKRRSYDVVAQNFKEDYTGTVIHDCYGAQNNTVAGAHQHCHPHYLRDLEYIIELRRCPWAYQVKQLLLTSEKAQKIIWQDNWSEDRRNQVILSYQTKLQKLIDEIVVSKESKTFQKRLRKHTNKVFHFLGDPTIPFHNNSSEQAIRNAKIHKKISGCFRSLHGAQRNSALLTFIETIKKHKRPVLESLKLLLEGRFYFCVE